MYNIIIQTRFTATHCWPECPIESVSYLKNPHRHEFHVLAKKRVTHANRDIEFIDLKNKLDAHINERWNQKDIGSTSCELICRVLAKDFNLDYVRVLEDGENGAEYIKEIK